MIAPVRTVLLALMLVAVMLPGNAGDPGTAPARPVAAKRIALTFDDVPRGPGAFLKPDGRAAKLLAALKRGGADQVAFFVNPGRISGSDGDAERIARYVAAGHVIANHSYTHPHLSARTPEAFLSDIDQAEGWLKLQPGRRPWFRFPFLDEGGADKAKRDAVRAGLAARGLQNGYVTADGSDWYIEQLTIDARKAGRKIDMAALRDFYVETHLQTADFADALAIRAIGRSPVHVLLLHETDVAALFIGDLIAALRRDGWDIVSADTAYADPVHAAQPDTPFASGTLVEALAWEKALPPPRWYERNRNSVMRALFEERVLHRKAQQ